jgi:steroid 5-alpha reductase family enzyme
MYERDPLVAVGILGAILWAAGFVIEAVADWQLAQFRSAGPQRSVVMDRGLWRFSRHPNYFGDICVWSGMFTMAAHSLAGLTTVVSPVAMFWLLAYKTGVPLLEPHLSDRKPAYTHYMARTSRLVPRPPRR